MSTSNVTVLRSALAALGGVSGYAIWALFEAIDTLAPAVFLAAFSLVAIWSTAALMMAGPLGLKRALGGALALAVPMTALISWAGLRYTEATDLFGDPPTLTVICTTCVVALPFLSSYLGGVRGYPPLFASAWDNALRFVLAWVCAGPWHWCCCCFMACYRWSGSRSSATCWTSTGSVLS